MANYNPNSFKYVLQDESVSKVCREVHVSFKLGKNTYRTFVFVPKKEGEVSKSYYIDEAKKEIDRQIKSGELIKNAKLLDKKHPYLLRGVLITTACVAMVAGAAGLTWHLTRPQPEPQPQPVVQTFKVVQHFVNNKGSESSYIFRGEQTVSEGSTYECSIELYDAFKATHEISGLKIVMNGEDLKSDDYEFTPSTTPGIFKLKIKKAATGNIVITGTIQDNTFNVYCSCVGCKWTSDGTADPIKTAPKNGSYRCFIKAEASDLYEPHVYGVTMDNATLTEGSDYTFNKSTGELNISKPTNGNIHIVSAAIEKVPTQIPVYHGAYGCIVEDKPLANVGENYTCTVKAADSANQFPQIVSASIDGQVIQRGDDKDYTFKESPTTAGVYILTIKGELITATIKEIYFSVIALDKPSTTAYVVFNGGGTCESDGEDNVELGEPYSCRIDPVAGETERKVRIVSVVMNGAIFNDYTFDPTSTTGDNFKIESVTGDINIVAIAQEVASTDHAVAIMCDPTECKVSEAPAVVADGAFYTCKITPVDSTKQIRMPFITMGGVKVDPGETGYTFNRESGELAIHKAATGDIIIATFAEDKAKSTFLIDHYCFESTFTGDSTYTPGTATGDYVATVRADDPDHYLPKLLQVKINGVECTSSYTLVAPTEEGSNDYTLTIPKEDVTGDVTIAISVTEKARSSFNVTIYGYKCNISDADNFVTAGGQYEATVASSDESYEPYVYKVMMGSNELVENRDYTFDPKVKKKNFKITKAADGDVTICTTATSKATYKGMPEYEITGGKATITGVVLPAGAEYAIKDITDVEIPSEIIVPGPSNDTAIPVTAISEGTDGKGILYGFESLTNLTIPFIGGKKTYEAADKYVRLFGHIFGTKWFPSCGSLTWQTYYIDEHLTTESYRITRTSIPTSLSTVTVLGGEISAGAFSNCSNIDKIIFKDYDSTNIGAYAFSGCKKLKDVKFPDIAPSGKRITKIDWYAFSDCLSLDTFDLKSVEEIKHHAFSNCSGITTIYIPNGVGKIETEAFSGIDTGLLACSSSRSTIEGRIASGAWASDWCDKGSSIVYGYVDDTMIADGDFRFIRIKSDDGQTYGAYIIEYLGSDWDTIYTIPGTLKGPAISGTGDQNYPVLEIGAQVYYGYTKLETVDFTQATNLQYIDDFCFTACSSLSTLTGLANTKLKCLGSYAFDRCPLTNGVNLPSTVTEIKDFAFGYSSGLSTIDLHETGIKKISDQLFYNCTNLSSVTLPTGITSLGVGAFDGCSKLSSLSISATSAVTEIPDNFCNGCSKLGTFALTGATALTRIGHSAFNNCSVMNSWNAGGGKNTLPGSVTTIGDYAFGGWTGTGALTTFTISNSSQSTLRNCGSFIFNNWKSSQTINIGTSCVDVYGWGEAKSTTKWGWVMARDVIYTLSDALYQYWSASSGSQNVMLWVRNV